MGKAIFLKTKIPGPKSLKLMKMKKAYVSKGVAVAVPIFTAKARNALITDVDGNRFIDFTGGISAVNSGHNNPRIVSAIKKQAERFIHTSFTDVPYPGYVEVCRALNQVTPGKFPKKTALFNSGAEAVENAIKIARRYTNRPAIVSFEHGFHGRTLLTMSLTSKIKPYKFGFGPFAPETYKLHYPYSYRMPSDCITEQGYVEYLLREIEGQFFQGVVAPENIAAVIMEPVTGEGGFIVPPKRYVQQLAKICRKHGILFIADEVQSGFGRTGKMFAIEHFGVQPDLITMAKSLSNGMPLSAVTGKANIMDSVQVAGLGGTFSGHPLSCAAAIEAIKFIKKNKLPLRSQKIGKVVMKRLRNLENVSPKVGQVRGLGSMCAMEIVKNKKTKEPDKKTADRIIQYCYKNGLLILEAGVLGNVVRTLMPLTIPFDQLNEGLDVLEKSVLKFSK